MSDDLVTRLRRYEALLVDYADMLEKADDIGSNVLGNDLREAATGYDEAIAAIEQHTGLVAENALAWFGTQTNLELHHYSPVFCDDDDQSIEWRVTRVSGGYNDREWTTVGRGTTPLEAIQSARAALAHPQGEDK